MSYYFRQNAVTNTNFSGEENWVVLSDIASRIKEKIEKAGKPLKDWDININYGIKTGFNEAFIIDSKTRDELIAKSPKSAEIIRPILRGRDIEKYKINWSESYLIHIPWHFPLQWDSSIIGASSIAENEFKQQYPAIYDYLKGYQKQLINRNKAETGTRYEWYALQRWGANYYEDFNKKKIMYPNMTKYLPFVLDKNGYLINDKGFIITGEKLSFLTGFFNSSLFKFCFRENFPELQGGTRELRKVFFENISIKPITNEQELEFEKIISEIQEAKIRNQSSIKLEKEIDTMIFEIYSLTKEEREIIGFVEIK